MSSSHSRELARRLIVGALAIIGLAVTALMTARVGSVQGLYVGQVEVIVHPPRTVTVQNPLATTSSNAISFAGLITEVATGGEDVPRVTSQSLTLADQGMRHQTLISLANLGGQWANDFSRPFIRIEAVDSTPEAVRHRLDAGVNQVVRTMNQLQQGARVLPAERATTETVPATPVIGYEGTHRLRAMAMTLLIGLVLTLALCRAAARGLAASRLRRASEHQRPVRRFTRGLRRGMTKWGRRFA